ncbi:killer cell lectin-like receptor subfamily B member 1B allele A isoform X2 [Crotalus tigris]|uniref:killer cell lectin-like receptor subfamily B member 1B allele A isoform X2 n=1 Tax=Crotalus tigris TaxID=88082 RepID=UPI00192F40A1|nr:killer cell lectin-like receptor subfamily B member 1B allele A isoform X2 [Crotalus tigris]
MAPKPPPPAAKPPAKGPAGPAKPSRPPTKLELYLSGYNCATIGVLLLFCLFLYTLWYISLCAVERAKRDPLRQAVAQIRQYMISRNAEYDALNDTEVLLEAEKVAGQLIPWAQKIKELQAEIADLHYKLNHEWTAYNNHLYLFNYESLNYDDTMKLCNKSKSFLTDIQDDTEERFIEQAVRKKYGSFWIGLRYWDSNWKVEITKIKPRKTYWKSGNPGRGGCARMTTECNTHLRCWISADCHQRARGICKQKPESKWMS